jgi:glutamine amidotransferase
MCRLSAYLGPEIPLQNIVVLPKHSLLEQSQAATEAKLAVNGDGFGVAWYKDGENPGQYRDVLPAWSDGNLTSLCRMISSPLFLAHVRASTSGETARVNCHPFTYGRWSFMHNGNVPNINGIRRKAEGMLSDDLYFAKKGTTDSELIFLLLLANGLDTDPLQAVQRTLEVCKSGLAANNGPNRFVCVFSDGENIYAFRHSSDRKSPTLYVCESLDNQGTVISSEPLDDDGYEWKTIPEDSFVTLSSDQVEITPLFGHSVSTSLEKHAC